MSDQTAMTVKEYFSAPTVRERFADVLGAHNAGAYMASVLLAVANTPALQDCTPQSLYTAALRAATLRLSVDPATKQAYLVPFGGRDGKKANLIVGYKGLYDMAMRTGNYKRIDVYPLYQGEGIEEDRITGGLKITGSKQGESIAGWLAIFDFTASFGGGTHHVYMTTEQIHAHARQYSKGYDRNDGAWKTATAQMEKKTVLRKLLMDWGYLDPIDAAALEQTETPAEADIEGEVETIEPRRSEAEIMSDIGFDVPEPKQVSGDELQAAYNISTPSGKQFGELGQAELSAIANSSASDEHRAAAKLILANWK